jgi:hypothetical protein
MVYSINERIAISRDLVGKIIGDIIDEEKLNCVVIKNGDSLALTRNIRLFEKARKGL